jgi:hypothetical protein
MFKSNETSSSDLFQKWEAVYCQILKELAKLPHGEEINDNIYKLLTVVNRQLFAFCENRKITNQSLLKDNLSKLIAFFSKNERIEELLKTLLVELPEALRPFNSLTMNEDFGNSLLNFRFPSEIFLKEVVPHLPLKTTIYFSQTCKFFSYNLKQSIENKKPKLAAGGAHTLIYIKRSLYSFGRNDYGQLGLSHKDKQLEPMRVEILDKRIESIACGENHSIIVYDDGSVYSFGLNDCGQLGLEHMRNQAEPQQVTLPFGKRAIFANCGSKHSLIVCDEGSVYSFGLNDCGQLGLGDRCKHTAKPQEVTLPPEKSATFAACGSEHSLIVCDDGSVYSFGLNDCGQLGLGHTHNQAKPQQIKYFPGNAIFVVCGGNHSMVLCENVLYAFGSNQFGQCSGEGWVGSNLYEKPVQIKSKVQSIACGTFHTIIYKGSRVYANGLNDEGQLGYAKKFGFDYEATPQPLKLTSLDEDEKPKRSASWFRK